MIIVFAKDDSLAEVQKLLAPGVQVRNPDFFKSDSDTTAEKVHVFGDYPAIKEAFKCEVIEHKLEESSKPKGGNQKSSKSEQDDPKADNDFDSLPEDTEFPYHKGSGYYFLSDGSTVRGGKAAENAQKQLDEG